MIKPQDISREFLYYISINLCERLRVSRQVQRGRELSVSEHKYI